ncbi:MAG: hypothetical protein DHS20C02_10550 [Micavibrio sp.]|nr:MAG: hypothetical protein DHS20C02_10550 [Micavibrio sp.]
MDAFDIAFDAMAAWNQVGLLIGGLVLVALGGLIIGNFVYWRLKAWRFTATIIGVRVEPGSKGQDMYYPVLEYTTPEGQTVQATADGGSSLLGNKIPGKRVRVLVMRNDPETVRIKGYFLPILGMILLLPGLGLMVAGFRHAELNIYTLVVAAAFFVYIGFRLSKIIKPKDEWEEVSEFQQRKSKEREEKQQAMKVLDKDEVMKLIKKQDKVNRFWVPIMLLVGLGVAGLGGYLGKDLTTLLAVGEAVEGRVVDVKSEYSSDSTTYYPIVEYQSLQGKTVKFKSKVGSNPPMNRTGDIVSVIYDPHRPDKAMIDRGIWNWAASGGCVTGGLLLAWLALGTFAGTRRRARL